jgi:LAGLIDADG-like domain
MEEKICSKCKNPWPTIQFYPNKKWKDGFHPWCKDCLSTTSKARYEQHCAENPPHHRWHRDQIRHAYFSSVERPIQAYLLGLLAADGNIINSVPRISLELSVKDIDLLTLVRDELAPGHIIRTRTRKGSANRFGSGESAILAFTSPEMITHLARFGIIPQKSLIMHWPSHLPSHLASAFLLGYFDGDGSITWTINNGYPYPKWVLTSGSVDLLKEIISIVREQLGITIGGPYLRPGSRTYTLCTTGKKAFLLDEWLHTSGLGLARKRPTSRITIQQS